MNRTRIQLIDKEQRTKKNPWKIRIEQKKRKTQQKINKIEAISQKTQQKHEDLEIEKKGVMFIRPNIQLRRKSEKENRENKEQQIIKQSFTRTE